MASIAALLWQTTIPSGEFGSVASEFAGLLEVVVVLVGILILAYFLLRFGFPKLLGLNNLNSGPMTVVARYALEPRKNLYIVRVGTEFFLVATSESNVQFLTPLDPAKLEGALAEHAVQTTERREFGQLLRGWKKSQKP